MANGMITGTIGTAANKRKKNTCSKFCWQLVNYYKLTPADN